MASDLNKVILIGRLTRDAELRYSSSGTPICRFSIANSTRKKVGDSWTEESNFFDAVLMGKRGEALHRYLTKGTQIGVEGELRQDRWEKDGEKKSRIEIWVTDIQLLASSGGGNRGGGAPQRAPQQQDEYPAEERSSGSDFEDDIPF